MATAASLNLLLYLFWISFLFLSGSLQLCIEEEREALLSVRSGFPDVDRGLSPWKGHDCCSWEGVGCNNITGHVIELHLSAPYGLSNSSQVHPSLFHLKHLEYLDIRGNNLSGHQIPSSIGSLTQLQHLDLSQCWFQGEITEAHFANLTNLYYMDISYNNLSVKVSEDWLPPFQASEIRMRSCNLGPRFPPWLQNQTSLRYLDISNNGIADAFPDWFWSLCLPNMELNGSHNHMRGTLPRFLECFNNIITLDLSYNNFEGLIPGVQQQPFGGYFDLSHNFFSGPIPSSLAGNAWYLSLSNNNLNGSITKSICTANDLSIIDLANNGLSGTLPDCFTDMLGLMIFDVSNNKLFGRIPNTLGLLPALHSLHFSNNNLSGTIPATLMQRNELVVIDFSWNELSGDIRSWLRPELSRLTVLSLRSNKFTGEIPSELSLCPSLQVLDLSHNLFSGFLPPSFGNFTAMMNSQNNETPLPLEVGPLYYIDNDTIFAKNLPLNFDKYLSLVMSIDLSNNNLSGVIPEELTNLHGLRYLNLSSNYFLGQIPEKIDLMGQLESLDLSMNNLSGRIPSGISELTSLAVLNLSYNNLVGKIPVGNQLQTFTNLSYMENPELCGEPLETKCLGDKQTHNDGVTEEEHVPEDDEYGGIWYFIGFAPGFVFGFWGFMGAIMIKKNIRIKYILLIDSIIGWFMHM